MVMWRWDENDEEDRRFLYAVERSRTRIHAPSEDDKAKVEPFLWDYITRVRGSEAQGENFLRAFIDTELAERVYAYWEARKRFIYGDEEVPYEEWMPETTPLFILLDRQTPPEVLDLLVRFRAFPGGDAQPTAEV
jgi:hypothetical protein